jgi:hypothetical protein
VECKDQYGISIHVGDFVRLLAIRQSVLDRLDSKDKVRIAGLIGQTFQVYEIDEWGGAWIKAEWNEKKGRLASHSLMLDSGGMEKVAPPSTAAITSPRVV